MIKFLLCLTLCLSMLLVPVALAQNGSCPLSAGAAIASITASGTTQIIAVPTTPTSRPIYINGVPTYDTSNAPSVRICSVTIRVNQAAGAADFGLVAGTGSACATGQSNLTPQWKGIASVIDSYSFLFGADAALVAPKGNAVCLKLSAAPTGALVLITYAIL